jgi:hypothetical protein
MKRKIYVKRVLLPLIHNKCQYFNSNLLKFELNPRNTSYGSEGVLKMNVSEKRIKRA